MNFRRLSGVKMLNISINVRKDLQACLCLLFVLTLQLLITIWSEIHLNCGNITSVKAVGTVLGLGGGGKKFCAATL